MSDEASHPMRRAGVGPPRSRNYTCDSTDGATMPPACGARTRSGAPCRSLAMRNGRCRMHGGASTGARTPAGLERVRTVGLVHGGRSRETVELRRLVRQLRADARRVVEAV